MSKPTLKLGILCDTGFLIRLNQPQDELHENARAYLKNLLAGGHVLYVSTIALAEYAVRDKIENLPMKYFRVLPFNIDHAQKAGEFAGILFSKRDQIPSEITQRVIIPNDTKMFAQADVTPAITHYLTADQAMVRAAARARAVAASTHTSIHIMKDGKIVEIFPAKEVRYPTSSKFQEEPELSVVREDPPPYGSQKL